MALVIRMQGFKDWKDGLITTEEMLEGKVFREPPLLRKMWEQIIARARNDWSKIPHHNLCCCDKCAPTEEDRKIRIAQHKAEMANDMKEFIAHDIACCCSQCLDAMEKGMQEMGEMFEKHHVPVVSVLDCNCDGNTSCELCYSSLAPSDCEE